MPTNDISFGAVVSRTGGANTGTMGGFTVGREGLDTAKSAARDVKSVTSWLLRLCRRTERESDLLQNFWGFQSLIRHPRGGGQTVTLCG